MSAEQPLNQRPEPDRAVPSGTVDSVLPALTGAGTVEQQAPVPETAEAAGSEFPGIHALTLDGLREAVIVMRTARGTGRRKRSIHDMPPQATSLLADFGLRTVELERDPGSWRRYRRQAKTTRVIGRRALNACRAVSPSTEIDEIKGDELDGQIEALRAVTGVRGIGGHRVPDPRPRGNRKVRRMRNERGIGVVDEMILEVPDAGHAETLARAFQIWLRTDEEFGGSSTADTRHTGNANASHEVVITNMTEFAPRGVGAVVEYVRAVAHRAKGIRLPWWVKEPHVQERETGRTSPKWYDDELSADDADYQNLKGSISAEDNEGNPIDVGPFVDKDKGLLNRDLAAIQAMRIIFNALTGGVLNEEQHPSKKHWFLFQKNTPRLDRPVLDPTQLQSAPPKAHPQPAHGVLVERGAEVIKDAGKNPLAAGLKIIGKAIGGVPGAIQDIAIAAAERTKVAKDAILSLSTDFSGWHKQKNTAREDDRKIDRFIMRLEQEFERRPARPS